MLENRIDKNNNKWWKNNKTWVIITIIFASAAIITALCLVLYTYVYVDEDEMSYMDSGSNGSSWIFKGSLKQMDSCQWDSDVKTLINSAYEASPALKYYFISSEVEYSDESNTSANFTLNFKVPAKMKPFMEYATNIKFAASVLRQFIYDQDMSWCNDSSISLEAYYTSY